MQIFATAKTLEWGHLDVPILGLGKDWFGENLTPPLGFSIVRDQTHLWFLATRQGTPFSHPASEAGAFQPELWKYDVAELFLSNPLTGEYLELNISPNGAWWASKFSNTRVAYEPQPSFQHHVQVYNQENISENWITAIKIPLEFLCEIIGFNEDTTGNVAAILNSPDQTFHSACNLPGAEPDFHQPREFRKFSEMEIPR
ncbi:hypothetical protein [Luteolibacter sp. AS25]|uniref:hypothetical protein n=1 Tax=Luteolibacter sp. AS25 TaxID=3135776 RepID=UPI00398B8E4C